MLGLKLPTDPRWVDLVSKDIQEILTDHAYCEQKAASNAISIIVKFPLNVDKRWEEFLAYEATLMQKYGKNATIHG